MDFRMIRILTVSLMVTVPLLALPFHEAVSAERTSIRGELVKFDGANNILVIKTTAGKKAEEIVLQIVPDTAVRAGEKIRLGFEKDAFSELKVGDQIGATYLTDAQNNKIAHSILKLSTAGKALPKGGGAQQK